MNAIAKHSSLTIGQKDRLTVKTFQTSEAMHAFLNKQYDNKWRIVGEGNAYPSKAGVYAYAGGQWHNVRNLDASVLAHI